MLRGGAGRGCPGVKKGGGTEGEEEGRTGGGRTSLNTTAAALESDPAGLSCYLASEFTPRPVAQRQPKALPLLCKTKPGNFPAVQSEQEKAAIHQYNSEERCTGAAPA